MLSEIKGQDKVFRLLKNTVKHNRISQSYLFHGPEGVGKFTTALYLGMILNCNSKSDKRPCGSCVSCRKYMDLSHPDFIYIFPAPKMKISDSGDMNNQSINEYLSFIENRKISPWKKVYFSANVEIRKESIEMLQKKLEFTQREGKYRICILEDADGMNQSTANSFLKTLEEPPENTVFILLTTKMQSVLPTILSRCQQVFFQPLSYKLIEEILVSNFRIDKQTAKTFSRIANGNLEQAIRFTNESTHESRTLMISFIEAALMKDDNAIINILSSAKDKYKAEMVHDMIYYLAMFIHDISVLKDNRTDIINTDNMPLLTSCSGKVFAWDQKFYAFLIYLDNLHIRLNGNVNTQFTLIDLYHEIKSLLSQ
jgi:DNA polymerase-3 subunit delta'